MNVQHAMALGKITPSLQRHYLRLLPQCQFRPYSPQTGKHGVILSVVHTPEDVEQKDIEVPRAVIAASCSGSGFFPFCFGSASVRSEQVAREDQQRINRFSRLTPGRNEVWSSQTVRLRVCLC